ncbi:putative Non-ribosomal peptide synthetase [Streptomyces sp. 769]|nr:putative Non-ribosomal peptide synthetase [Streptomyces sp. 769]
MTVRGKGDQIACLQGMLGADDAARRADAAGAARREGGGLRLRGVPGPRVPQPARSHRAAVRTAPLRRTGRPPLPHREGADAFLAAFLVGHAAAVDLDEVRTRLRTALPDYMMPSHLEWLPSLPLTPSGKRDDALLRRTPLAAPATDAAPPTDEHEKALVGILSELLELPSLGVRDNFFDIGGTSLTAMRLVMTIEKRCGVSVPLSAFVAAPTVSGLAERLRAGNSAVEFDPVAPIRPQGSKPPLFLVHPLGGHVLCYVRLARHLPDDQPVYARRPPGPSPARSRRARTGPGAPRPAGRVVRRRPRHPPSVLRPRTALLRGRSAGPVGGTHRTAGLLRPLRCRTGRPGKGGGALSVAGAQRHPRTSGRDQAACGGGRRGLRRAPHRAGWRPSTRRRPKAHGRIGRSVHRQIGALARRCIGTPSRLGAKPVIVTQQWLRHWPHIVRPSSAATSAVPPSAPSRARNHCVSDQPPRLGETAGRDGPRKQTRMRCQ